MQTTSLEQPLQMLSKIAQSSKAYYQLLHTGPRPEHFAPFLESLTEGLRSYFLQKGFEASQQNILFRRFVLERAGQRMDAFLQERLDSAEYKLWQEQDSYPAALLLRIKLSE